MGWKDRLRQIIAPPDPTAEQEKAQTQATARARAAVNKALRDIKDQFEEARREFPENRQVSVSTDSDYNSSLTVGQRVLSVRRADDGRSFTVNLDSSAQGVVIFNQTKQALVLEDRPHDSFDLADFIGERIIAMAK